MDGGAVAPSTGSTSGLPSPEEVAAYREDGWHVTGQVVAHHLLDEVRALVEEHQHRPPDRRLPASTGHTDWSPADGPGVRNSELLTVQDPRFAPLTLMPLIGHIAALLPGTDEIPLFDDQAVLRPPTHERSVVGWHTDHGYWSTCTSDCMLTAWIPFEDATIDNGTLAVVDGSHLRPDTENLRYFNVSDPDRGSSARQGQRLPASIHVGWCRDGSSGRQNRQPNSGRRPRLHRSRMLSDPVEGGQCRLS